MTHTFVFERQLNRLDALHYHLGEHRKANVAMCMVAVLDCDIDAGTMREGFAQAADEIPRFKDRFRPVPGGLAPPVWEPDPRFDIHSQFHEVELNSSSDWPAVLARIDEVQSGSFVRDRPPWAIHYMRNAPNDTSVVVLKLHHALSDGTALTLMLSKVFMREALGDVAVDVCAVGSAPPAGVVREAVQHYYRSLRASIKSTTSTVSRVIRRPSELRFHSDELREYIAGPARWLVADHSPARRSAYFRVPLSVWRDAARERGGGVNDLYVALAAATLQRYLAAAGADDGRVLAIVMPIDIRSDSEQQDGGNVTGAGVLELTGSDAELMDLSDASRQSRAAQETAGSLPPSLFDSALALCPGPMQRRAIFRRFSTKDALATNVIIPLRCGLHGAQATMVYLLPPVIGTPISFALAGYDEAVHLAVNMDTGLIDDPGMLEILLEDLLAEIFGSDAVTAIVRNEDRAVPTG